MTCRQSNTQWSGGIAAHPDTKNSECKNLLENSQLDFSGSRRQSPNCLPSKGPNYKRGLLPITLVAIEGHFEGKTPGEYHQCVLVLKRKFPGSPGTSNPEEISFMGFQCLDHQPCFPDLPLSNYNLFAVLKNH